MALSVVSGISLRSLSSTQHFKINNLVLNPCWHCVGGQPPLIAPTNPTRRTSIVSDFYDQTLRSRLQTCSGKEIAPTNPTRRTSIVSDFYDQTLRSRLQTCVELKERYGAGYKPAPAKIFMIKRYFAVCKPAPAKRLPLRILPDAPVSFLIFMIKRYFAVCKPAPAKKYDINVAMRPYPALDGKNNVLNQSSYFVNPCTILFL
jgi:hypothetical protein